MTRIMMRLLLVLSPGLLFPVLVVAEWFGMRFELHTGIVIGLALSAYLLGALLGAWR